LTHVMIMMLRWWQFELVVTDQRCCSMPVLVITGMGDRSLVYCLSI